MIADADGNGQLSAAEKRAMIQCLKGAKLDYDHNRDKVLTVRELRCAMKADVNKDGKMDAKEMLVFERCLGIRKEQGAPGYDADHDGQVSAEEAACGLDLDGNGKASEREKAFALKFDADKNGKLDKEERKRAATAWALERAKTKGLGGQWARPGRAAGGQVCQDECLARCGKQKTARVGAGVM